MKKVGLFSCFIVLCFAVNAQADTAKTNIKDTDIVFTSTAVEASFPGEVSGWSKYLQKHLNMDVIQSIKLPKHFKEFTQQVNVSFIVDTVGNIAEVKADNASEVYPELAKESIRVIKEGPKWIPATLNGRKVISRKIQPITWDISDN